MIRNEITLGISSTATARFNLATGQFCRLTIDDAESNVTLNLQIERDAMERLIDTLLNARDAMVRSHAGRLTTAAPLWNAHPAGRAR